MEAMSRGVRIQGYQQRERTIWPSRLVRPGDSRYRINIHLARFRIFDWSLCSRRASRPGNRNTGTRKRREEAEVNVLSRQNGTEKGGKSVVDVDVGVVGECPRASTSTLYMNVEPTLSLPRACLHDSRL